MKHPLKPNTCHLITNFITQYTKPFSPQQMAGYTSLPLSTCQHQLDALVADNKLKCLEPGIYCTLKNSSNTTYVGKKSWKYSISNANLILDQIDSGNNTGCRQIGKALGVSRQYAYMYLVALASIGAIGFGIPDTSSSLHHSVTSSPTKPRYYVISRANLSLIGTNINPGIIATLRANYGITQGNNGGARAKH